MSMLAYIKIIKSLSKTNNMAQVLMKDPVQDRIHFIIYLIISHRMTFIKEYVFKFAETWIFLQINIHFEGWTSRSFKALGFLKLENVWQLGWQVSEIACAICYCLFQYVISNYCNDAVYFCSFNSSEEDGREGSMKRNAVKHIHKSAFNDSRVIILNL